MGAPFSSSSAEARGGGSQSGSVYIFNKDGNNWAQTHKLVAVRPPPSSYDCREGTLELAGSTGWGGVGHMLQPSSSSSSARPCAPDPGPRSLIKHQISPFRQY